MLPKISLLVAFVLAAVAAAARAQEPMPGGGPDDCLYPNVTAGNWIKEAVGPCALEPANLTRGPAASALGPVGFRLDAMLGVAGAWFEGSVHLASCLRLESTDSFLCGVTGISFNSDKTPTELFLTTWYNRGLQISRGRDGKYRVAGPFPSTGQSWINMKKRHELNIGVPTFTASYMKAQAEGKSLPRPIWSE